MEIKTNDLEKMAGMNETDLKNYVTSLYKKERGPVVYGYARVSTRGQAVSGNSLESQREALKAAGASEIFTDAYTGKTMHRPEFDRLMKQIQPGDTIIVTKLDRFARSAGQAADLISDLIDRGITVNVLNVGVMDNTPTGKLIRQILLAFAQFERDLILERTAEGKTIARQNPNFREGRPKKFSQEQINHAMTLLNDYSYTEVQKMTGISRSTLVREHKKIGERKAV